MKIAFVLEHFPYLSETFILNQITNLLDSGEDVDIIARFKPKQKVIHSDVGKYNLINKTVYTLEISRNLIRIIKNLPLFFKFINLNSIKILDLVKSFFIEKNIHPLENFILPFEKFLLLLLCLEKKYDIIHCHFGKWGKICVFLKKLRLDAKLITTFYGVDLTSILRKYGINYYDNLRDYGDLFFPICNYFKLILLKLGFNEKRIIIHPLGIDIDKFKAIEDRTFFNSEYINLISIGRLVEKKGFEFSIRAISKLKSPNIKYYIIGDGPLRYNLEKLCRDLNVEKSIIFKGFLDHRDVIELLKKAHIFILTSITADDGDKEGTPTVLLEAQSMGLPVISTTHSGIPEIVINGKSGYLVPERNIKAIKEKVELLLKNPDTCRSMSSYGRTNIKDNFNIVTLVRKIIQYYNKILVS